MDAAATGTEQARSVDSSGLGLLRSKLEPARAQLELVRRDALLQALLSCRAPLVLVSAPAGYGKSTVLAQWAAADSRPAAWLQLDAADNDPVVLWTYLIGALAVVTPVDLALLELLQQRRPPLQESIVPALGAAIAEAPPFLFAIDDGHELRNAACWEAIGRVLDALPEGAQAAVGSRHDPPLPLARLRSAGRLAEFRTADLAMSRSEAQELFTLQEFSCDDETLDAVLSATEGWATGLYLALLAGEGRASHDWLPNVHGDRREIAGYLVSEVLERQPPDVQQFLLRTSLLTALSAPLCDAVTGRGDAHEVLARLARENLFVAALDDRDEWYRYHHLFGELLRALLERREAGELAGLHRRAASWYHGRGEIEEATCHWLAAGDVDSAADPVAARCDWLLVHGQEESARRLLAAFTDDQLLSRPALTLAAAMIYGSSIGDPRRERWCAAALSAAVDDGPSPVGTSSMRSWQLMLRTVVAPDGITRMLADAELARKLEDAGGTDWREYAQQGVAFANYFLGRLKQAERMLQRILQQADDPDHQAWALSFLALVAGDLGRWDEAADFDDRSVALPTHLDQLPMPLAHLRVLARRDDPGFTDQVRKVERFLEDMVFPTAYKRLLTQVILGEVHLERGKLPEAERWATSAERTLRGYPDAGMLRGRVERLRQALEERRMTDPLTAAERRVLELLPTQLTAEQIAARLFVSKNTVKTHMRRLYMKLGVTSRTGAVERARELKLLRGDNA